MAMQMVMKKARIEDEDRISKLSDDLIHQIMLFMDIRLAVQTSVLSKRWKFVWTNLPFLNINDYNEDNDRKKLPRSKFLHKVFNRRNRQSRILKLELYPTARVELDLRLTKKYVKHAILHNVEHVKVKSSNYCALSMFNSDKLKYLTLTMKFESDKVMESHCWTLPSLTTLFLARHHDYLTTVRKFPKSCLLCLPALTTLGLDHCKLPEDFSFPGLTTLFLESCILPKQVWDLPGLVTLELRNVVFPANMSEYFRALVSLQNLLIDFATQHIGCCVISSYQLVNLEIRAPLSNVNASEAKIVVLAPKLYNFTAIGFFPTTFEGSVLENVNIKFWDWTMYSISKKTASWVLKQHQNLFRIMFSQLGSAKILTLDSVILQALSEISDILVHLPSPFYNLKYLKLPYGCEESCISSSVREYLLSGSPSATIVKTLSQDNVNSQKEPYVSVRSQNVVREEHLETPTNELIDYQYTHKNTCDDTVEVRVPKEHMVEDTLVDAHKVRQIGASVAGAINDRATSSRDKSYLVLWRGHEVNSEFVGLLNLIMKIYPRTFEKLTTKNQKIWTMKLNMLCSSVHAFTKTSKTEVDTEMLAEYRVLFTDLQRWGFNLDWMMSYLNYVEQLWFSEPLLHELHSIDSRIDDAKSKLQDLQTLRAEKMTDSDSSRTMGTSLAVMAGYNIGDDILQEFRKIFVE